MFQQYFSCDELRLWRDKRAVVLRGKDHDAIRLQSRTTVVGDREPFRHS